MKKTSIQKYLFKTIMSTLLLISLSLLVVGFLVIGSAKNEFIYHEIEEAIEYNDKVLEFEGKTIHINSFKIIKNKEGYEVIDRPSKQHAQFNHEVYEEILNDYQNNTSEEGRLIINRISYYYISETKANHVEIYFIDVDKKNLIMEALVVFALLTITVFIASLRISKYLSKPVEALSTYSEEIANKNWKASLDDINNLELSRLGDDLNAMKLQLEKADIEERQFLQATSHDLKTPIMIIKGYIQAMIEDMPIEGELQPKEVILQETKRLERKVNQLVHLNTIGYALENQSHYDLISVNRVIKHIVEKLKVVNQNIRFNISENSLEINADGEALRIAFENIIENQLRYAKSYINIEIEDKCVKISNDGPFFDQSSDEMFEIYKKGKSGQFGLGLAITKKVIDAHKGKIQAYNLEEGVCFEINF